MSSNRKKYEYLNLSAADDGSIIITYDENVPCKSSPGDYEQCHYDRISHTKVATDVSSDEGKKAFADTIVSILTSGRV